MKRVAAAYGKAGRTSNLKLNETENKRIQLPRLGHALILFLNGRWAGGGGGGVDRCDGERKKEGQEGSGGG